MSKREFRPKDGASEPRYPHRRRFLALGAAAALASLGACGPIAVTEGVAVMPEDASVDAGPDASLPDGSLPDASEPDGATDAGPQNYDSGFGGAAPMPDGGE